MRDRSSILVIMNKMTREQRLNGFVQFQKYPLPGFRMISGIIRFALAQTVRGCNPIIGNRSDIVGVIDWCRGLHMANNLAAFRISAVLFQEGGWWSAQCLEYDIAAQAKTLPALRYELQRVLISHIIVSEELGCKPFEGLDSAPQKYWDMFEEAKLRVESDDLPFRLPHPATFPPVSPRLRIAEMAGAVACTC
jgi:hypothetical protein